MPDTEGLTDEEKTELSLTIGWRELPNLVTDPESDIVPDDTPAREDYKPKIIERQTPLEVCERIFDQFDVAYDTYIEVMNKLMDSNRRISDEFMVNKDIMLKKLANWLTNDKIVYVMNTLMIDPNCHFTLIAVPNLTVSNEKIISLFNDFASKNNMEPNINTNTRIDLMKYTAGQLAGCDNSGKKVRFGLMPSKPSADLPTGTAIEQRKQLAKLKKTDNFLRAPSLLDSLVYDATLYNSGDTFHRPRDRQRNITHIRNYAMKPTVCGSEPYVLSSSIVLYGVEVMGSMANSKQVAYAMVGQLKK